LREFDLIDADAGISLVTSTASSTVGYFVAIYYK
jgi:hypothetical protein